MKQLFNPDSAIMRLLGRMGDILLLNFFFLLACLPVVTVGAAKTALCSSVLHLRREEGYPVSDFWRTFRREFRQSLGLFAITAAGDALLFTVIYFYLKQEDTFSRVLLIVCAVTALIFLLAQGWFFRLQARFQSSVGGTVRNAVLIALSRPFRSFLIVLGELLPAVLLLLFPELLPGLVPVLLLIWFSAAELLLSRVADSVLLPLIPGSSDGTH